MKMVMHMNDRYKKLEYIANGIHAANKISKIYSSDLQTRDGSRIRPGKLSSLNEIIGIIAQYYPGSRGTMLGDVADKTASYSEAYRNVKHQVSSTRGGGTDAETVINTLRAVKPALGGQRLHTIDKIIKIYEIIKS